MVTADVEADSVEKLDGKINNDNNNDNNKMSCYTLSWCMTREEPFWYIRIP